MRAPRAKPAPPRTQGTGTDCAAAARVISRIRQRRIERRAELATAARYVEKQYALVDKYSEAGAIAELKQQEDCVNSQNAQAEDERKEVQRSQWLHGMPAQAAC